MTSGKLAVLLPTQCAIGTGKAVKKYKELMLQKHHLDAVFSLPIDIFHPGANASACCMIFDIGIKHDKAPIKETFFGYYRNDGFTKRKNLGRVEKMEGIWEKIKAEWLDLYFNRKEKLGLSVVKSVKSNDEWLAEAYMETDYSSLDQEDFQQTLNNYLAYLVKGGCTSET
jgi:N-6 DNA Methylase.